VLIFAVLRRFLIIFCQGRSSPGVHWDHVSITTNLFNDAPLHFSVLVISVCGPIIFRFCSVVFSGCPNCPFADARYISICLFGNCFSLFPIFAQCSLCSFFLVPLCVAYELIIATGVCDFLPCMVPVVIL